MPTPQIPERLASVWSASPVTEKYYRRNSQGEPEGFTYDAINSRVGIGNTSPSYKLHIGSANNSLRIEGPASNSGTNAISVGGYGDIEIDAPGIAGGRFVIKENGNVGIGTIPIQ